MACYCRIFTSSWCARSFSQRRTEGAAVFPSHMVQNASGLSAHPDARSYLTLCLLPLTPPPPHTHPAHILFVSGNAEPKGVRPSAGYGRPLSIRPGLGMGDGGVMAGMMSGLGIGGGGGGLGGGGAAGMDGGHYLTPAPAPKGPFEALLGWLYRGWSAVSLVLLAVAVMVVVDSRRAARIFKQVGLGGYPLYGGGGRIGEYDPTADSGISGTSEGSASAAAAAAAAGGALVVASGVRGEVRVGCLTVSDTVLGYGSHGTVVYRGLLEGRPVAVKRMLTDFHARADREISLLIESDG